MKMQRVLILISFLLTAHLVNGQVIGETNWESIQDFSDSQSAIVANILWLEANPFSNAENDTKGITQYVLKWLTDAPHISVTLDGIFLEDITKSKRYRYSDKFVVTYLFGKAVYIIQNPEDKDELNASFRGVSGMVKVYDEIIKQDPKVKNKRLAYFSKLYKDGRLRDYVAAQLAEQNSL